MIKLKDISYLFTVVSQSFLKNHSQNDLACSNNWTNTALLQKPKLKTRVIRLESKKLNNSS